MERFPNIFLTQEHTTVTPANVPTWTANRSRVQRAKFVGMQHEKWRAKEGERGLVREVKDCPLAFPYHSPLLCFTLSVFPTAPQLTSDSLRLPSFCKIISHPISCLSITFQGLIKICLSCGTDMLYVVGVNL